MHAVHHADAAFFTMVHGIRREARLWNSGVDRRSAERHAFAVRQWIALYDGEDAEGEREFREVDCQDLSTGGFSFLVPEIPEGERLSIRLGGTGNFVYLTAQMVSCQPIDTDGGPGFLIGCRFTGRTSDVGSAVVELASA